MIDRPRRADLLLAAATICVPALASLLGMAARGPVRPDLAGLTISIVVLVVCIGAGYTALRWYRRSEKL